MEEVILEAMERDIHAGRFREAGFIPGVLYGDTFAQSASVKFSDVALRRLLSKHGSHAKVWVRYGNSKKFGFVKEVQKNVITGNITHVDVQIMAEDQELKMQLPILFKGEDELKHKQLVVHVQKPEVEVVGKAALMPEMVVVDLTGRQPGDSVTARDFSLDPAIKLIGKEDEIYAVITHLKATPAEEPEQQPNGSAQDAGTKETETA
ncbi:MAG TPA: 50S ribosomal protein L25 [Bacillota bacterium]|nr:50S ribosomal protein L25 [Bacillota bacterium]